MIMDIARAVGQLGSRNFLGAFLKVLAATVALLVALGSTFLWLLDRAVQVDYANGWIDWGVNLVAGLGVVVGAVFLVPLVSALVAGLFLDDMAEIVEGDHYPNDRPGKALPLHRSVPLALRFLVIVALGNLLALTLLLVPGVNVVAFLVVNAYLLGREYFEFAALRFHEKTEVDRLRAAHGPRIFIAGLAIAGLVAIPILNLLTPLFATALMVHVHKRVASRSIPG